MPFQAQKSSTAEISELRSERDRCKKSVEELERAIEDYLRTHNEKPRPFVWTKSADLILDKVKRICERLAPSGKTETNF